MAAFQTAETPQTPDRLWIWERDVYRDEDDRTWVPVVIKTDSCTRVLMRQEDVPLGEPQTPSQLVSYPLPLMWQLYPGKRYRGTDSMFWRIVYHIKFRGVEDMLLEQLPSLD
uniref:T-cell leukemia/lymphoma protein 1A n=1 Tax=Jaculus jaculus TaxID=51337 RepID=UPI0003333331|nr:T-cell leukemia/lymphoma protein 1A [Jaculus jaculus]